MFDIRSMTKHWRHAQLKVPSQHTAFLASACMGIYRKVAKAPFETAVSRLQRQAASQHALRSPLCVCVRHRSMYVWGRVATENSFSPIAGGPTSSAPSAPCSNIQTSTLALPLHTPRSSRSCDRDRAGVACTGWTSGHATNDFVHAHGAARALQERIYRGRKCASSSFSATRGEGKDIIVLLKLTHTLPFATCPHRHADLGLPRRRPPGRPSRPQHSTVLTGTGGLDRQWMFFCLPPPSPMVPNGPQHLPPISSIDC